MLIICYFTNILASLQLYYCHLLDLFCTSIEIAPDWLLVRNEEISPLTTNIGKSPELICTSSPALPPGRGSLLQVDKYIPLYTPSVGFKIFWCKCAVVVAAHS